MTICIDHGISLIHVDWNLTSDSVPIQKKNAKFDVTSTSSSYLHYIIDGGFTSYLEVAYVYDHLSISRKSSISIKMTRDTARVAKVVVYGRSYGAFRYANQCSVAMDITE